MSCFDFSSAVKVFINSVEMIVTHRCCVLKCFSSSVSVVVPGCQSALDQPVLTQPILPAILGTRSGSTVMTESQTTATE